MKENKQPNFQKNLLYYYLISLLIVMVINWVIIPSILKAQVITVNYSEFLDKVSAGKVSQVQVNEGEILFTTGSQETKDIQFYKTGRMEDPNLIAELRAQNVDFGAVIPEKPNKFLSFLLSYILPIAIFIGFGQFMSRTMQKNMSRGGLFLGQGNSAKVYVPSDDQKTFDDVAGQEEAKESLAEIIDYLKNPEKYADIGAKCPRGTLLVGPPGTGKTLMAKAVAGEANVPFFSISGSEFVEMFVGRGAAKVRELFDEAKKKAPCIVFIDEIDTIGKKRDSGFSSNDEREQTLNQLLTEMDGFEDNKGVIILAATNRPEILDPALLRPGRFDRQVRVELPDIHGRIAILDVHLKNYKVADNIDKELIARSTAGASGAEIANIVNEAALRAVRFNRQTIEQHDLEEAIEVVIAGQQKKNNILSPEERRIVSYHEIGHAMVAAQQSHSAPVQKITIIPRTSGALGYTLQVEEADKNLVSRNDALAKMATLCGGRAAEKLIFKDFTTGASNDIEKVTQIARAMVMKYGMSDTFGMMALETGGNNYLGNQGSMTCSAETASVVDKEVRNLIEQSETKAYTLLKENEAKLHELAEYLLTKETITGEEFMEILDGPVAA